MREHGNDKYAPTLPSPKWRGFTDRRATRPVIDAGRRLSPTKQTSACRLLRQRDAASATGPLFVHRGRPGRLAVSGGGSIGCVFVSCRACCPLPASTRPELPPFQGGWAGLFGYELGCSLERVPRAAIDEFGIPALAVGLYDVVVAFDHAKNSAWLISQGFPERDPLARGDRARARLTQFRELLDQESANGKSWQQDAPGGYEWRAGPSICSRGSTGIDEQFFRDAYLRTVRAGDRIHLCRRCVSGKSLAAAVASGAARIAVELYCRVRGRNPAPFAGYFDRDELQIASASPERFIQVRGPAG